MDILDLDIENEENDLNNKHVSELNVARHTLVVKAIFLVLIGLGGILLAAGILVSANRRSVDWDMRFSEAFELEPFILFGGLGVLGSIAAVFCFRAIPLLRKSISELRTINEQTTRAINQFHYSLAALFGFGFFYVTYLIVKHSSQFL
jgi:hypothetical protein